MTSSLLQHYLSASDAADAEPFLSQLLERQAEPLIQRVVRSRLRLRSNPDYGEIEDVCSDAMVSLVARLDSLREAPGSEPIANFDAYVTTIAHRACSEHYRRQYPMFHRLRNRLRYALQQSAEFGIWHDESGEWLCGKSRWQPAPGKPRLIAAAANGLESELPALRPNDAGGLFAAVFTRAKAPIAFDELARIAASCWAVLDAPHPVDTAFVRLADPGPLPDSGAAGFPWLQDLWREILELPPNQRAALLLNLRDEDGACATSALVVAGTAGLADLAASLDMGIQEFAELWRDMPLDDLRIAGRLGVTRQQVINLRKCAKERLARRMKGVSR